MRQINRSGEKNKKKNNKGKIELGSMRLKKKKKSDKRITHRVKIYVRIDGLRITKLKFD